MDFEEFYFKRKKMIVGGIIGLSALLIIMGFIFLFVKNNSDVKEENVFLQSTISAKNEQNSSLSKAKNFVSSKSKAKNSVSSKIYVDVKGAILKPGMYCLKNSQRVFDAINLAGGLAEGADSNQINYAALLVDQMVIYVPKIGEDISRQQNISKNCENGQKTNRSFPNDQKINLNTATSEELQKITGIGAKKAQKIIEYRQKNGTFKKVDDLREISGFGEKIIENIRESITV